MKKYNLVELVKAHRPITYGIVQPGPDVNPNGIPLIRGKDYSSGKVATEGLYHVLPEIDKPYTRSKVETNDILLSIAGYVGQIAIVPKQLEGANITQTTARISCDNLKVNYKFLFYFLQSETFYRTQIKKYEKGSAQKGLNLSDVEIFKIDLPPLPQQQKIAKILTTCDAVIEKTEAAIAKYQAMKQGLMHDLFTRGIDTNTGKLRPKYEDAKHLYKQSELGWIPKEWEVKKLEEFLILKSGEGITSKDIYSFKEYPVYGGNGLRGYTDTYTHQGDYVLIGRQGALCGNITLADKKFYASEHAVVVTIMNDSHVKWVEYKLRLMNLNQYSEASAQPGLSVNKINRLYIKVPNGYEQNLIARKFIVLENKINTEESALSKYQKLKTGLMQDLLSGKVEVKL